MKNWLKFLVKFSILSWLFYSLYFVACEKSNPNCPLPDYLKFENLPSLNLEKIPILHENIEILKVKLDEIKENIKSTPVGLEIFNILDKAIFYYHESATAFVEQVLPPVAKNIHHVIEKSAQGWQWFLEIGFPWLRVQIATGAKFLRKIVVEYYPRDFVDQVSTIFNEKWESLSRKIQDFQFVQDLLKNEKLVESYANIMDYTSDLRAIVSKNLHLWLVEYPVVGFDYFWRVLEDDVPREEYEKIFGFVKSFFSRTD